MTFKRGIGLSVIGDGKDEEVIVHLANSGYGYRDFKFVVDFNDTNTVILSDAVGYGNSGVSGQLGTVGWDYSKSDRHWHYDYSIDSSISIYIFVGPGESCTLIFNSLKILQEKGDSQLKNPTITIDGNSVTFPVDLYASANDVEPHMLVYDGNEYSVYSPVYELISGPSDINDLTISSGVNTITVSSDTSNTMYSTRADVRVSVYDDGDRDGIPTNGDYYADPNVYTPYDPNSRKNFFDDNCPCNYNPDQADSDGDGIGDECDT